MAGLRVSAKLRDCRSGREPEEVAEGILRLFLSRNSKFRMYRYGGTLEFPTETEDMSDVVAANENYWDERESGSWVKRDRSWGIAGKSAFSRRLGFNTFHFPEGLRDEASWFHAPRTWTLYVEVEFWESLDYVQAELSGPMWERGQPGVADGWGNLFANHLLDKAMEVTKFLKPSLSTVGVADPWTRKPVEAYREREELGRLEWANLFGRPYVKRYGRRFLLDAPGFRTEDREDGTVLYQVTHELFVMCRDEEMKPEPAEVLRYFRAHPHIKAVRYEPVLATEYLPLTSRVESQDGTDDFAVLFRISREGRAYVKEGHLSYSVDGEIAVRCEDKWLGEFKADGLPLSVRRLIYPAYVWDFVWSLAHACLRLMEGASEQTVEAEGTLVSLKLKRTPDGRIELDEVLTPSPWEEDRLQRFKQDFHGIVIDEEVLVNGVVEAIDRLLDELRSIDRKAPKLEPNRKLSEMRKSLAQAVA